MDTKRWTGVEVDGPRDAAVMLIAILAMSNDAEARRDPFTRRIALNEMQAAIQSAKSNIEALAEGFMLGGDDAEPR